MVARPRGLHWSVRDTSAQLPSWITTRRPERSPSLASGQCVEVSCKVYDPTIVSVNPDGYWYQIATSPWNNQYYAPANMLMNGDPWGGPYTHNTDFAVPDCWLTNGTLLSNPAARSSDSCP